MDSKLIFSDILLFYKVVYGLSCVNLPTYLEPIIYTNLLHSRLNAHIHENKDTLMYKCTIRPEKDVFINTFFYRSYREWNKLPFEIRTINSFDKFKIKLKEHIWLSLSKAVG